MAKKTMPVMGMAQERKEKVAIYIRVSTSYQIDKDSLQVQRRELIAYAEMVLPSWLLKYGLIMSFSKIQGILPKILTGLTTRT